MSAMAEALARIDAYANCQRSPRSREVVERELSFFQCHLSEEVYEYYQWSGAPMGNQVFGSTATYRCLLERYMGSASDVIYFASLNEAEELYQYYRQYSGRERNDKLMRLPFVSSENSILNIVGSETPTETCPVVYELSGPWFPSLTNMMLAIAESIEAIGNFMPDCPSGGSVRNPEQEQYQREIVKGIAQKYGSPSGRILMN